MADGTQSQWHGAGRQTVVSRSGLAYVGVTRLWVESGSEFLEHVGKPIRRSRKEGWVAGFRSNGAVEERQSWKL